MNSNRTHYQKCMLGRKDQFAQTPDDVLKQIQDMFNEGKIMFDPCPANPTEDGLDERDWTGDCVYVNPPYKNITPWLEKGLKQSKKGKKVIFLIPARADTEWWHHYVIKHAYEIYFIKQGIRFKGYDIKCPFAICLVVFQNKRIRKPGIKSVDFYEKEKAEKAAAREKKRKARLAKKRKRS